MCRLTDVWCTAGRRIGKNRWRSGLWSLGTRAIDAEGDVPPRTSFLWHDLNWHQGLSWRFLSGSWKSAKRFNGRKQNGPIVECCFIPHFQPTRWAVKQMVKLGSASKKLPSDANVLACQQLHSSKLQFGTKWYTKDTCCNMKTKPGDALGPPSKIPSKHTPK